MTLPPAIRGAVEAALEERVGRSVAVTGSRPVTGGCVSPAARVDTSAGESFFLKWRAPAQPGGLLPAELRGLRMLAATGTVRVPDIVASPSPPDGDWLLLEWIEPGAPTDQGWSRLGADLAALHRVRAEGFGGEAANFIGSLPQSNEPAASWPEFWRTRRLEPQVRLATDRGGGGGGAGKELVPRIERLFARLDDLLDVGDAEGASLLHGDLWSGNLHMAASGPPALIDPSAYHGHREVDLAMADLFGGFGAPFRAAYEAEWPLEPGYGPVRRAVYQLYYLLVHLNLFGAGYLDGCRRALQEAGV